MDPHNWISFKLIQIYFQNIVFICNGLASNIFFKKGKETVYFKVKVLDLFINMYIFLLFQVNRYQKITTKSTWLVVETNICCFVFHMVFTA